MRNLSISLAMVMALTACGGPSGRDVGIAKQARYKGDKLVIFRAAKTVTEAKYKIDVSDETAVGLRTKARWFTPEGVVAPGGDDNMQATPDLSIRIALVVQVLPDGEHWIVEVVPSMQRYYLGRPNTEKLDPRDPSVPGWATGQADELQFAIYQALKAYVVQPSGAVAPPPALTVEKPAPPAAPDAGSAGSGAAGSGTPP